MSPHVARAFFLKKKGFTCGKPVLEKKKKKMGKPFFIRERQRGFTFFVLLKIHLNNNNNANQY